MKKIRYNLVCGERLFPVSLPWSEENEVLAKTEAHNGEYTVEDDGTTEPETVQTTDERIAALEEELKAAKILLGVE